MKLTTYILFFMTGAFILGHCVDPIQLELESEFQDIIVIQGRVIKGQSESYVTVDVSRLYDFSLESRLPVSVRQVVLYDDKGNEMELTTRSPGLYRVVLDETNPVQAEVGVKYHLVIQSLDGRTFESTPESLTPTLTPGDIHFATTQIERLDEFDNIRLIDRLQVSVDTKFDSSSEGGLFWEVREIHKVTDLGHNDQENGIKTCYVDRFANVFEINTLDPKAFSVEEVTEFPLLTGPLDGTLKEGKYYEIYQYALSEGAFKYWNAVDILSEREGSVFDGPVGEVPTNFFNSEDQEDKVYGYFFASEEKLIRKRVPETFSNEIEPFCQTVRPCFGLSLGGCLCGICCDCLDDPDASLERPSWWVE